MTTLTRWAPWHEMTALRRALGGLFDEPLETRFPMPWRLDEFDLTVDVAEDENAYVVKASLPGVKPEEVEVTLQNNVLTLKGEAQADKEINEERYHVRERHYGRFMRSLTMPTNIKADMIEASHENGVLTVRLPKAEENKPKKIAVKTMITNGNGKI